jgi:ubiquinone/menaquinone biosynthesis C-methylase UbiE
MVVRRRPGGRRVAVTGGVAAAYSLTGGAWQRGPGRVYDRLAEVLIARCPVSLHGCHLLDVGAGTGAAGRAAQTAGTTAVIAVDAAIGMLTHDRANRPPAAAGDAMALPFSDWSFDAAVAAFSLNHLTDPAGGLREMARVTRPGGALVAGTYAADDAHPVKAAVEAALTARGWEPDPWYAALRAEATPLLATIASCGAAAGAAGLHAEIEAVGVEFPELGPPDLVAWRLGMAQHAPFVDGLPPGERDAVAADAVARLGDAEPLLVRSILVLRALKP